MIASSRSFRGSPSVGACRPTISRAASSRWGRSPPRSPATCGGCWAIVFAGGGCEVALYDAVAGVAEKARGLVADGLDDLAAHGLVKDAKAAAARVRAAASLVDALDGATFVQENTPERVEVKREIFAELDRLAAPDAILASSTSTIVASAFTESLAGRHRCLVP